MSGASQPGRPGRLQLGPCRVPWHLEVRGALFPVLPGGRHLPGPRACLSGATRKCHHPGRVSTLGREKGLPRRQPQACSTAGAATGMAGLHSAHTFSFDACHRELLTRGCWRPCSTGCGEEPVNSPHGLLSPRRWKPQAARTETRSGLLCPPAPRQACSSLRRVHGAGSARHPGLHAHLREGGVLPEEPQHWPAWCSLPWGLAWPGRGFTSSFLPTPCPRPRRSP